MCVSDVLSEEPNKGVRTPWRNSEGKFASRVLRLNNNLLTNTTGLMETLSALFTKPKHLTWLDLSFNDITNIHPVHTPHTHTHRQTSPSQGTISFLTRIHCWKEVFYLKCITGLSFISIKSKQNHSEGEHHQHHLFVSQVLTELVELRVLYLHGNSVCNLSEVDKLRALPHLHTITLHGNNIEHEHGYR